MKGNIGIILNDDSKQGVTHTFFAGIVEGFRQKCNEEDYCISFLNSTGDTTTRAAYSEQAKATGCCGVLLACAKTDEEVLELIAGDMVVGTIDQEYKRTINVSSDNSSGMKALMDYILGKGHRKIAIITGDDNLVCSIRLNEYVKALENHGIPVRNEYIVRGQFREVDLTSYLTERLLKLDDIPTCIIFSDDYAAIGGINTIHARGLLIPRDISVAGYDGDVIMSQLEPALTSVVQDTKLMGRTVAEKMIKAIEHPESRTGTTEIVKTRLQIGRSVGRVYE